MGRASKSDGPAFEAFTPTQWYQALAAEVVVDGALVANPNTTWAEVDPSLPDPPILAFVPARYAGGLHDDSDSGGPCDDGVPARAEH